VKGLEDIDKDLMNHRETKGHAERIANPAQIEKGGVAVAERKKHRAKRDYLREHVTKEKFEFPVQASSHHDGSDPHLQDRMSEPERVVENFNSLAHRLPHLGCSFTDWIRAVTRLSSRLHRGDRRLFLQR
jgi:hypothetical protein